MQAHGGQLLTAAQHYSIPLEDWIDLSTGINPHGFPIPSIPARCWQRLPEDSDDLVNAAQVYYQTDNILAVAGSQAAIQSLPLLFPRTNVGVLAPSYTEHAACWQQAGHKILTLTPETIDEKLAKLQVLIIVNPNNPTGYLFSPQQLLTWHRTLQSQGGTLIVDEAFMDTTPSMSLSAFPRPHLIILRSIGKFFGLAGIRCGFVIADPIFLKKLQHTLGPWGISHPSRYVAIHALSNERWQQQMREQLPQQAERLREILRTNGLMISGRHVLFQWVKTPNAEQYYQRLAQQGILVRLFQHPLSLRFGLAKTEVDWQKLADGLAYLKINTHFH